MQYMLVISLLTAMSFGPDCVYVLHFVPGLLSEESTHLVFLIAERQIDMVVIVQLFQLLRLQ